MVNSIVTRRSASTILFNVVDNYKQCGQHNIVQFFLLCNLFVSRHSTSCDTMVSKVNAFSTLAKLF